MNPNVKRAQKDAVALMEAELTMEKQCSEQEGCEAIKENQKKEENPSKKAQVN